MHAYDETKHVLHTKTIVHLMHLCTCRHFSQVFTQMDEKGSPQGSELFAKSSLRVCRTGLQRSLRGLDRIDAACRVESTAGLSTKPPSGANLVHRSLAVHLLHMHSHRGITVLRSPSFLSDSTFIFRSNTFVKV